MSEPCWKCDGTGILKWIDYSYPHGPAYLKRVCENCEGTGRTLPAKDAP